MKKRKISLGIVLFILAVIIIITVFISTFIGKALEKEVEQLFPKLAANSNIEDVEFNFAKGIYLGSLKMLFLLESGDTCYVEANKIRLGIDISKFLFQKGKVQVSRLRVDSVNVSVPMDFDSINALELESDIKRTLRRFSRRDFISKVFYLSSNFFTIEDLNKKELNFNSLKIKKRSNRDFYFSFIRGGYEDLLNFNYVKLHLKNYGLSSSAVLSNDSLSFNINESLKLNEIVDGINGTSRKIRKKISSLVEFDLIRLSIADFTLKDSKCLTVKDVTLSLAGSENIINFGFNCSDLIIDNDTINSCTFNITADDAGVISRDFKIFTPMESVEASGKLSFKSADSSSVIFSLKGADLLNISKIFNLDSSLSLNGNATFNGVFKGVVKKPESWKITSDIKLSMMDFKINYKHKDNTLKIKMAADSLHLDSALWERGQFSGGCIVFTNDTVKYNTVFSLDINDNSFFVSRLYSIPIFFGKEKMNLTASALSLQLDSIITDSIFPVKKLSTEILRIENNSNRKFNYKRYKNDFKKTLRTVNDCNVKIGMLSIGKDSVSLLEAKSLKYLVKDSLNHIVNISSLKIPDKLELSSLKSSFYVDHTNRININSISLNKIQLDAIGEGFKKVNKKNIHTQTNKYLRKIEKFSSVNTRLDMKNIKINLDSLESISIYNISAKLTNVDTLYSSINISNIKLPESLDNKLGQNIRKLRSKFKQDGKKLLLEDFKLEADGSRYYCDGNVMLVKNLPCSLSVNLENIKLFRHSRDFLKDSTVNIRGGAYSRLKFTGNLLRPRTWKGKGSILLKNLHVDGIPLQKIEIITKYAPPFSIVNFADVDMNPIVLRPGGQMHIKAVHAKGKKLNFTGWGSMDFRGRFYFEMNGKVKGSVIETLPNLTQLALNKGDDLNYGKFYAKLYGSTKKQYLVPEKGIHGKVIRSKFRQMGASFRNLFN